MVDKGLAPAHCVVQKDAVGLQKNVPGGEKLSFTIVAHDWEGQRLREGGAKFDVSVTMVTGSEQEKGDGDGVGGGDQTDVTGSVQTVPSSVVDHGVCSAPRHLAQPTAGLGIGLNADLAISTHFPVCMLNTPMHRHGWLHGGVHNTR